MKKILVFGVLVLFLAGCSVNYIEERRDEGISLGTLLHNYDLWYVDINATRGNGKIPFLQKAVIYKPMKSGVVSTKIICSL